MQKIHLTAMVITSEYGAAFEIGFEETHILYCMVASMASTGSKKQLLN